MSGENFKASALSMTSFDSHNLHEALRLATSHDDHDLGVVMERAQRYYEFLAGFTRKPENR